MHYAQKQQKQLNIRVFGKGFDLTVPVHSSVCGSDSSGMMKIL